MTKTDELINAIESLPINMQTSLINKLLANLYSPDETFENLWKKTAEKRIKEIENNPNILLDGEKVFAGISKRK